MAWITQTLTGIGFVTVLLWVVKAGFYLCSKARGGFTT